MGRIQKHSGTPGSKALRVNFADPEYPVINCQLRLNHGA